MRLFAMGLFDDCMWGIRFQSEQQNVEQEMSNVQVIAVSRAGASQRSLIPDATNISEINIPCSKFVIRFQETPTPNKSAHFVALPAPYQSDGIAEATIRAVLPPQPDPGARQGPEV
jgi:hypothetical protein